MQKTSGRLAAETLLVMGKTARDVGYTEWLSDGPLAGWESISLDYYSQAEIEVRAEQRSKENTDIAHATRPLRGVLPARQLDQVLQSWTGGRVPADAFERALAVRDDPSLWRTLLVEPNDRPAVGGREVDGDTPPPKGGW